MTTRKEMVPARKRVSKTSFTSLCGPEWRLLCWIRREIRLTTAKATKAELVELLKSILETMDATFDNWLEDPK